MKLPLRIACAVALCLLPLQLRAGYLGHSVTLTFEEPPGFVVVGPGDPPPGPTITNFGTADVGSTVEFTGAKDWNIDVSDTSIRFTLGDTAFGSHWALPFAFGFQGFRLRDADGTLPEITDVSIGFDSHVGLSPSQVSFDGDNVMVDMTLFIPTGWAFGTSGECQNAPPGLCQELPQLIRVFIPEFVLDVQFAPTAVPLPGTAALAVSALLLVAGWRRR